MKIWVTGAAGFLGRRLIKSLQSTGHHVVGLSRRISPAADHAVSLDLAGPCAVDALTKLASGSDAPVDMHADVSDARRLIGFEPTPLAASLERYAAELRA